MSERNLTRHRPKLDKAFEKRALWPFIGHLSQVQSGYMAGLQKIKNLFEDETRTKMRDYVVFDLIGGGSPNQDKTPLADFPDDFKARDMSARRAFEEAIARIKGTVVAKLADRVTRDELDNFPPSRSKITTLDS